jgi:hypothetical protein
MTPETSPLVIAGYVLGAVITIPALIAIVKLIFFVASASTKLDQCLEALKTFGVFKHEAREKQQEHELRLSLVERDVEQLKESAA